MLEQWKLVVAGLGAFVAVTGVAACSESSDAEESAAAITTPATAAALDTSRLPLGDGKRSTSPRKGYACSCQQFGGQGGAGVDGPWIDTSAQRWDANEKMAVQGMVRWSSRFSLRASGTRNRLSGNGLPGHTTGVFPIQSSDPAYRYDRNPNSIRSYTLAVSLPRNPRRARRIGGGGAPSEGGPPDGGSPR